MRSVGADVLGAWRDRLVGVDDLTAPVVVGCSGGPDSSALLALAADRGLAPVAVHVDHGLRAGSAAEAVMVADLAERLGVAFRADTVVIAPGANLEARARDARYAALEHVRDAVGATAILVGHTADDQAETVLLNLLRGSASAGLGGMPVRRGSIVRPLLGLRRDDAEAICAALGFEPVRDPTNADTSYRRAWVRHELLPRLCEGAQRDVVPVIARQADVLRSESEYLDGLARAAWPPSDGDAPAGSLARLPLVLARRAVRQWIGAAPPSLDEVDRVLAVARGDARAVELAGGRRIVRSRGQLRLER